MAQVVLGAVGGAIGGGPGRAIGQLLGAAADQAIFQSLTPARPVGPRLETLRLQSSAEGSPMACAFGRARVTGQMIWAARFLETRHKGGSKTARTVDHAYSLSFAVAICEGPIDGVGRIWADGQPMDLAGATMRIHRGTEDQTPDPLIEAVEGSAPAYRGTAYAVFEDLPLGPYGDRAPQLSFEVFRRPLGTEPALEDRIEGVCLIPGAGEFHLATEPVFRRVGLTQTAVENVNHAEGRPDLEVSLDQLIAQAPNLKRISLVVGWFGDDLRAGECRVRPGVERRDKPTEPLEWSVAGLGRHEAHLISEVDGRPAYGGTPSDQTVRQAIAAMKARGLEVTLYPFVFMDIAADNALPDPYGRARQPPHPWRGRIKGRDGAQAAADVAAVFGTAEGWGLRRMARHYAAIAAEAGADGLLIGSEMRGLTWTRDGTGAYPAVERLCALAAECRGIVGPGVRLSYAADWSEYSGHRPDDGSGDVIYHLDPLWAHPAIDYVGIDWYPPMGDWRNGEDGGDGGIDADWAKGPRDPAYLAAQVAGGEGFDWFYADEADRATQTRTPIVDTAHGEHWVFRVKDVAGWLSNAHHDRPGGARATQPTAWVPGMKPVRLTEVGCAAVDRGANAPNLFQDPKSAESFLPPYSTGARDDRTQRRMLEAVLKALGDDAVNPTTPEGGRMIEAADLWCWDARPYPAFPARDDLWGDTRAWRTGHWLNGRLGGEAGDLIAAILRRGGLNDDDFTVREPGEGITGYVIDRPMRTRDAVQPLVAALGLTAAERDGRVFIGATEGEGATWTAGALALPDDGWAIRRERTTEPRPATARVRFIDAEADYQTGAVQARARGQADGGGVDLDLPAACDADLAMAAAERMLAQGAARERTTVALGPLEALRCEVGDRVTVEGLAGDWIVEAVTLDETPTARLKPVIAVAAREGAGRPRPGPAPEVTARPFLTVLETPPLPGAEGDARPLAAVSADPWRAMDVHVDEGTGTFRRVGEVRAPATVGRLTAPLAPGRTHAWDETAAIEVALEGGAVESVSRAAVLGGANALAIAAGDGWEIVQFRRADLVGAGLWRLTGLLRGRAGTEAEAETGAPEGALVVRLDERLVRLDVAATDRGAVRRVRAGPAGAPAGGAGVAEAVMTVTRRRDRPWRPAHLTVRREGGALSIAWTPRSRRAEANWDLEPAETEPRRFQVTLSAGGAATWTGETADMEAVLSAETVGAADAVEVRQWGEGYGWGEAARAVIAP